MYRLLFTAVVTFTMVGSAFSQTPTAADADFNNNGVVDIPDFLLFIDAFGSQTGGAHYDEKFDLDGNGIIGIPDFLIFVDLFGQTVPMIRIADANLHAVIADSLGKASGEAITVAEMATLTRLEAPNEDIGDVTGLEHATNLTWLDLGYVMVGNFDVVNSNAISDLSPLSGLTNLEVLRLGGNSISDVSALSGLTLLQILHLSDNAISDVSALSGLTNLIELWLGQNAISDLAPLVANTRLGSGDIVAVWGNPLSDTSKNTHIPALQGRGVFVSF